MQEKDFQIIVDRMSAMTCVVSVETLPDGKTGKFRIVTGNKAYIDSIVNPPPGAAMLTDKFTPNTEYTNYLTRDLNFEDFCYRSAVKKKCLHSYAHPDRMNLWFNMLFIPLDADNDNLSYCLYMMEISFEAESENMSDISTETASSVLDICIRLRGTNDFNATIKDVVAGIRDLCDAEHCCILTLDDYNRSCHVLGEAFSENSGLLPMQNYLDEEFYDIAESWNSTIAGSNCLIAKDEQDMEVVKTRNPVWYKSLSSAGAQNIVLFPLKSRNELLGYMWAVNFDKERAGTIKETLELTTFILGSELGNYMLLDRLRMLSSKDLLTGVMNRNEMNNYVDSLCNSDSSRIRSVGVIFADLNGLKAVNDVEGHNAGDILLKNAANVLREIFNEQEIFRAGGDEFSVIITDITDQELNEKIELIRTVSEEYGNVVFALGGAVENDSRNVRMALRHADERMYEDKRRYYEQNPEKINENRIGRSANGKVDEKFREVNILHEMNYDQLTGLPSMTYFIKLAETGRKNMHDNAIDSAVLFINFMGMKFFNMKYGFAEGDNLIREFALILSDTFGEESCSRFGQDHFAAYTKVSGLEDKLKKLFKDAKKINNGKTLPVRAGIYLDSMGLVEVSLACDRAKVASNIKKDDKSSGFDYFDSKLLAMELNRQYIVNNIDKAINENWIKAFYQPIVRAAGRRICDEEALARWIDPEKGMLSPADFIPILEDTRLIYKVDLHIVDIILEKIKHLQKSGMKIIPISVNLSRTDFESCDIVEEINNRVEAAGVSKSLITIEITESVVGENFDFMKEQILRFQRLGFKVWMDDFGSGYSSLDLLQEMQFDLIKFDMRFMRQFDNNPRSRIVLTELMRMAQSLGIETICEGVETAEQADFLSEIGCTKLQGYYFSKPLPAEEIWEKFARKEETLGFEKPYETEYYRAVGTVSMYDLSSISSEENETAKHYFNTLPMSIIEYDGEATKVVRCNRSYREFLIRYFGVKEEAISERATAEEGDPGYDFVLALRQCREEGNRIFLNDRMADGSTVHIMIKMVAESNVMDVAAFAVVVLDITPEREKQLTYAKVAHALSSDYEYLYYVDTETEHFVEYSHDGKGRNLSAERHGEDFFRQCREDAKIYIYEGDRTEFIKLFTRENVLNTLDEQGVFVLKYRLMKDNVPTYVNMKVVRMESNSKNIIIGVNNVDAQMRQQETLERLREEQTTYSRIYALMGNYIAIFTVDPETGNYMQYSASDDFSELGLSKAGTDFYMDSIEQIGKVIHPDDYEFFISVFSREIIREKTRDGKVYKINYRLILEEGPVPVSLRACIVQEQDGPQMIVGVNRSSEDIKVIR
ncbi:MAG: EAL domain-containing protein [Lachnospiraceae bacterium]|nr:EAL domain-containing protein [Lachnospiraceae bacterium]